jgi:hypothetical protein
MQVFVSWSGARSREIAEAIRSWLPKVIQSVKPWMSDQDISAGAQWLTEVSTSLHNTNVGLICVTPENQHNPWLLFEAGALSKTLEQTCVCPIVFEMTPGQLSGPLTQFQANPLDRSGIGKVLFTINNCLGDRRIEPQQLEEILDVWWPKLQERLAEIQPATAPTASRTTNDQLEEILMLVREQLRRENIRLEASKERDEKLEPMLHFMDQAGKSLGTIQSSAERMHSAMTKTMEKALTSQLPPSIDGVGAQIDMENEMKGMLAALSPRQMDISSMQEMVEGIRGMQERDKERHQRMISPPTDASNIG